MGSHAVLIPGGHWYLYYSNKLNEPDHVVHMAMWQFSVWREICSYNGRMVLYCSSVYGMTSPVCVCVTVDV